MRINFFACSNGLGHTTRCIDLASRFCILGYEVQVIIGATKGKYLSNIENHDLIKITFVSDESLSFYYDKEKLRYIVEPLVLKNDINVIDTNLNLLHCLNNCILLSNFLWHEVIDCQKKIQIDQQKLFDNFHGPILGHNLFAMDSLKFHRNFYGYEFLPLSSQVNNNFNNRNSILVSCGASERAITEFAMKGKLISQIAGNFEKVFLDKHLSKNKIGLYHENIQRANFDDQMFNEIDFAIIRPGLGTIRDLVLRNIKFDCVFESHNKEMFHNYNVAKKNNFIFDYLSNNESKDLIELEPTIYVKENNKNNLLDQLLFMFKNNIYS